MARGRMINESVATDKRLNSLSIEAQLVYLMTIPHLDRDGLILGEPYLLWGEVCRRRPELRDAMPNIIDEWLKTGLAIQYEGDEDPILFFVGFTKNQQGLRYERETPSKFPAPPGWKRTNNGLMLEDIPPKDKPTPTASDNVPDEVRQSDGVPPAEWNGSLREGNTRATPPAQGTRREVAHRQARRNSDHTLDSYSGCKPELLTKLTNCIKRIYRYDTLIDDPGDDKLEDKLRREAYRLWERGFVDENEMAALALAWDKRASGFHDKRPYGDQLYELAISLRSNQSDSINADLDFAVEDFA